MEYKAIAGNIIASLLTIIFVFIFNKYIKPTWNKTTAKALKQKAFLLLLARYLAMITAISLLFVFFPLTKLFVFILSLIFAMLTIMVIYDYTAFTLKDMVNESEEERILIRKQSRCNHLIKALLNTDKKDTERRTKILAELKKLNCKVDWSIFQ